MRILVLGSRGQLGQECLQLFAARHAVAGMDVPDVDIACANSLSAALAATRPEAVVNCAAYTAVDRAETESELCHAVNAVGPGLLGAACAARDIAVVHLSTDYVFDGERTPPAMYVESDATNPLSVYGRTKRAGEQALLGSGARAAVLRTAWLYGIAGRNFPKTMLRLALTEPARTLRVVDDQWGTPTEAGALARQLLAVLEAPEFPTGIFHATSAGYATWFEFAAFFLEAMNVAGDLRRCGTADYPTPARRPRCAILRNAALAARGLDRMADWRADALAFVEQHRDRLLEEARRAAAAPPA